MQDLGAACGGELVAESVGTVDGWRAAVEPGAVNGSNRRNISVGAYLVLRTVMVFNAVLLVCFAVLLGAFMERPAGLVACGLCCFCAGAAIGGARWLDRMYDGAA
jgi:hypothetical protein